MLLRYSVRMDDVWRGIQVKLILSGALVGFLYGLSIRFGGKLLPGSNAFVAMTLGFMVFLPLAMGFISVFIVERRKPQPLWVWFLLPWISVFAGELATVLTFLEGTICVVMYTPIALGTASIGGFAAGLIARKLASRTKTITIAAVLFLPLVVSAL